MSSMSDPKIRAFLMAGTRTGKLAWVSADGEPHVTPIWFVLDGDDVVFTTGADTGKGRGLAREGLASMVVDLEEPPYAYVRVDGIVRLSDDLDDVRRFATTIGARYMGEDRAEEFGARNGVAGEVLVRIHPLKVTADFDVTG